MRSCRSLPVLEKGVPVRRGSAAVFPVLGLVALGVAFAAAQVSPPAEKAAPSPARHGLIELDEDLQALAERVGPAVVTIEVTGLTTVQDPNTLQTTYIAREQESVPALSSIRRDIF